MAWDDSEDDDLFKPPKRQDVHLVCPDCGTEYETEDGDGGCPRCYEYDEVLNEVLHMLLDLRPTHLEDYEIVEAVGDGAWRYLCEPRNAPTSTETPRPASTTKEEKPTAYAFAQQLQKAVKDLAFMSPEVRVYVHIQVHVVNGTIAAQLTSRFAPGTRPNANVSLEGDTVWLTSEPDQFIKLTAFLE